MYGYLPFLATFNLFDDIEHSPLSFEIFSSFVLICLDLKSQWTDRQTDTNMAAEVQLIVSAVKCYQVLAAEWEVKHKFWSQYRLFASLCWFQSCYLYNGSDPGWQPASVPLSEQADTFESTILNEYLPHISYKVATLECVAFRQGVKWCSETLKPVMTCTWAAETCFMCRAAECLWKLLKSGEKSDVRQIFSVCLESWRQGGVWSYTCAEPFMETSAVSHHATPHLLIFAFVLVVKKNFAWGSRLASQWRQIIVL